MEFVLVAMEHIPRLNGIVGTTLEQITVPNVVLAGGLDKCGLDCEIYELYSPRTPL